MSPRPSPTRSIAQRIPESANPLGGRRPASPTPNTSTSPRFSPYNVPSSPATSLKDLPPHEIRKLNQFLRHHTIRMAAEYLASYRLKAAIEQGILPPPPKKTLPTARYTPCMDLVDDPDSPTVMAVFEVPGCSANDLTVRIQDSKLLVHGERRPTFPQLANRTLTDNTHSAVDDESIDRRPVIQHREVRFGTFFRDINVPMGTRQSDITARLENGMLTVTWPRKPHQQSSHTPTMAELHTVLPPMIAPSA